MKTSKIIRSLNLDPGLTAFGWSVTDYDTETGSIVVAKFGKLEASKQTSRVAYRELTDKYTKRVITVNVLKDYYEKLVMDFTPDYIVSEDVFIHKFKPNACIALIGLLGVLDNTSLNKFEMPIYRMPARSAKLAVSGFGGAGKDNIQTAVLTHDNITFKQQKQAESLSEHEADSVAIGYAFFANVLPGLLV